MHHRFKKFTAAVAASLAALTARTAVAFAAVPDPGTGTPPPGFDKFVLLLRYCAAISLGMCVLGFLVCAAVIAVQHRTGGIGDHGSRVGAVMAACILVGSASGLVTALT